jgi:uncharacterized protein
VTRSAIYEGRVVHRRRSPRERSFSYRVFLMYLDLDELPRLFEGRWLWSYERANVAGFRRADYLGDPSVPLRDAVLTRVEGALGFRPTGPVRMLGHVRQFGYVFNPVVFYYCFAADGEELEAVVAEITNTPWGERHAYVLDARSGARSFRLRKEFHVSPFFGMDHEYRWRFSLPAAQLSVHMRNHAAGERVFDADLLLERRELSGPALAGVLARHPCMSALVSLAIYWQALRLWLARTPFFPHPSKAQPTTPS